jgi:hypothetical protein
VIRIFLITAALGSLLLVCILLERFPVGKDEMFAIAKSRHCSLRFELVNHYYNFFDNCIYSLQPHFDHLMDSERKEVALYFLVYGQLDSSSAFEFSRLINPYHDEIISFLENVSDVRLRDDFLLTSKEISEYRTSVKIFKDVKELR